MFARRIALISCFLSLISGSRAGFLYLWDGFEREIRWSARTDTGATGATVDQANVTEGKRSLEIHFHTSAAGGKARFGYNGSWTDWSPYGALLFDIYNPTGIEGLRCGVAVTTGDNWVEHEIQTPPLKPGWNRDVRVDLRCRNFATSGTGYKPSGFLANRGDVRNVEFIIYPGGPAEGSLFIDNLRLERAGLIEAGPLTVNDRLDFMASAGEVRFIPPDLRLRESDLSPIESFESGPGVDPAMYGGKTYTPVTSGNYKNHGDQSVRLSFPAAPDDGVAFTLSSLTGRLAGAKQLRFDLYSQGLGGNIALTLRTSAWKEYYSEWQWYGHGWRSVVVDFTNPNRWNGEAPTEQALADPGLQIILTVFSRQPGDIYLDRVSVGDLKINGAARAGTLASVSLNPRQDLELVADYRAADEYYGEKLSRVRNAGPQQTLDGASLRWDSGAFRSSLLYKRKPLSLDNPIYSLVQGWAFGTNSVGGEFSGRVAGVELRSLAVRTLEYSRFNDPSPTGLGPDFLAGLQLKRTLAGDTRLGLTYFSHQSNYPMPQGRIRVARETWAGTLEGYLGKDQSSLSWAGEGGYTVGDKLEGDPRLLGDRGYGALRLNPKWKRLEGNYTLSIFGQNFDGDYTEYGTNWIGDSMGLALRLEGLGFFKGLERVPLYDKSLAKDLTLRINEFHYHSRGRAQHPRTGEAIYQFGDGNYGVSLNNDNKGKPHFNVQCFWGANFDIWSYSREVESQASLDFPLPADFRLNLWGSWERECNENRYSGEQGRNWIQRYSSGFQKYFKFNLFLALNFRMNSTWRVWEGVPQGRDQHVKCTGEIRQILGPNSFVSLEYGQPALKGWDYGIQDSINIYTLTLQTYF